MHNIVIEFLDKNKSLNDMQLQMQYDFRLGSVNLLGDVSPARSLWSTVNMPFLTPKTNF